MKPPASDETRPIPILNLMAAIIVLAILALVFMPVRSSQGIGSPTARSISNLRQIAVAAQLYSFDSSDRLPSASTWMDSLQPYVKSGTLSILVDPTLKNPSPNEYGYAYSAQAGDVLLEAIANPEQALLAFPSSDLRRNAFGGLELLPKSPRADGKYPIAHIDTSAKRYEPDEIKATDFTLLFKP